MGGLLAELGCELLMIVPRQRCSYYVDGCITGRIGIRGRLPRIDEAQDDRWVLKTNFLT